MNASRTMALLGLCLLISCLAPGAARAGRVENNDPSARLTMADSRTYVSYYAREKKYEALEGLLKRELFKIETDCEEAASNATTDKICDREGEAYVLDDLAALYTFGLVDFEKAKEFNSRAARIHEKTKRTGLESLPVSPYFNTHRFLYYTFYMDKGFFDDAHSMRYAFDKEYVALARQRDFNRAGERIAARKAFLDAKLGLASRDIPEAEPQAVDPDLFRAYLSFIRTAPGYSPFEKAYITSGLAMRALAGAGADRDLYIRTILEAEPQTGVDSTNSSIAFMDKVNRLNYRVTMAALQKGMNATAITHHERLVRGIDQMERAKRERIQAMVALLQAHYQEDLEKTNKLRNAGKSILAGMASAFVVLGKVAATAAAAAGDVVIGAYSGDYSAGLTKATVDMVWKDRDIDYGVNEAVMGADFLNPLYELDEGNPNRLNDFMSPYALRLNRYLNKYEMRAYLTALGDAYAAQGNGGEAFSQYAEAVEIVERQRVTIGMERQRMAFFGREQDIYPKIIRLLVSQGKYGSALEYVEHSKSRAFLDVLSGGNVTFKSVRQQEAVQRHALARAEIDSILESTATGGEQAMHAASRVQRAMAVVSGVGDNSLEEIQGLSAVSVLDQYEIGRLVPEDSVLVEYYMDSGTLYIFTVADKHVRCDKAPLSQESLIADIKRLRASILEQRFDEQAAARLHDRLLTPVHERIKGKRLIIVPHMALHYIPFQCLMSDGRYLVEEHALSYAPSATILSIVGKKRTALHNKALVVGNPTGDLEHAEHEAVAIGRTLPDSEVVLGANATEPLLKNRSGKYSVIHIASHGEFDAANPMASRIMLNSDAQNDGMLKTNELFGCQWRASLVTLSACQSGIGGYATGDELVGLQRGVFFAGTQSLLASTWRVDDASTRHLMTRFYAHAMKDTKDVALQKAQLETAKKYAQPFHWASFKLIGAANKIYEPRAKKPPKVKAKKKPQPKAD